MAAPTLEDRAEILDTLYRYCRGIDRLDEELVRSCYHPDAIDNHGLYSGSVDYFLDKAFHRQSATVLVASHTMHQSLIEVEGDAAVVETYANAVERSRDEADRDSSTRSSDCAISTDSSGAADHGSSHGAPLSSTGRRPARWTRDHWEMSTSLVAGATAMIWFTASSAAVRTLRARLILPTTKGLDHG